MDILDDMFSAEEVELTKGIQLGSMLSIDKRVWSFSGDGRFTVKNAYHLEYLRGKRVRGESSKGDENGNFWWKIWGLNVQPCVKQFIWKACLDMLPTRENLWKKQVVRSNMCLICNLNGSQFFMWCGNTQ